MNEEAPGRAPVVGETFGRIPHGQGIGVVIRVEHDPAGVCGRVLVEYAAGCMPMPPDDDPGAPMDTWKLPMGRVWFSRHEWLSWADEAEARC